MSMISLKNVSKFYYNKTNISSGFTKLNLDLDMGEFVVITGESGSGKSTLLNVISGLDSYEEGEMYINGQETSHYTEVDYENYRRKYIGNIFQHFNLVNSYTVYQNVELVLLLNGYKKSEIRNKVLNIIETVGLSKYKNTKASKLSGGQKQRVAIARALAKDTPVIVADEPTGNLDIKSAKSVMKLLKDISANKLVVIVTHNYEQVEKYATRKIAMNDGKIIEDKKLQSHEKCDADIVHYKDLSWPNKLRLGMRNAFNIKTKFLLLFFVYFFLTMLVFSEYSGLQKQDFTDSLAGTNEVFQNTDPKRVVVNKKDKTAFGEDELTALQNMSNVERLEQNDLILDASGNIYDEGTFYSYGIFGGTDEIDRVDEGRLPEQDDEIVLAGSKDSYDLTYYADEILGKNCTLQENNYGFVLGKVKIVGIVYDETLDYRSKFYLRENMMKKLSNVLYFHYLNVTLNVESERVTLENNYDSVKPHASVARGEVSVYAGLNSYCSNYDCLGTTVQLQVDNIYYNDSSQLKVTRVIDNDNYKSMGANNYGEIANTIFLNPDDYKNLFEKGTYQISIFLDDLKNAEETLAKLADKGYDYYFLKENLVDPAEGMKGIIRIIRNIMFLIATGALFFISYVIIKIILKSRNVYFSTIRILGATKKVSRQLLNIELFIDINVAYFVFIAFVVLTKVGLIGWKYLQDLVTYFTMKDYLAIYLILAIMSLLISNRYAHKLFKDSVMNTYREEV